MAKSVKKTYEKELFIIRGLPGSGKTTLANSILGTGAGIIHSSDDFFTSKKNVFHFDKLKLNEALKFNQKQCEESCSKGILRIIVDDNHVKRWSVKPIIETGKKYNYKIIIREPETTWWKTRNVNEMAKRSKHNYSTNIIKKLLEMWDTDFSIESILKEKIPDNKEEIIDQLVQNPIKSTVPGKNPQNVNNKKINSRHNHHNGPPPPKGNINSGRNNYVAPKPRNLDNYRSQPYYGPGRGRDTPNSRGGSYYDRPANNSFDRGSGGRHAYKPPVSHDRGYYSPPPPPPPPPSSGYRNSYPPSYDRYDRNDDLPPLPPPSYDRYDRNDNPPPYYDRYGSSRGNNIYEGRDRGRNDSSLPPPPPPHNDRYSKRVGGGAPPPIYDKYDRGSSGGNPPPQYYNRRDNPPPPPPPVYDRDRRTNHPASGYDRRSKGPPPPAPRYDRRDHAPPPSAGYYDTKNDIGSRGYYGRGSPPPPHTMSNPPPYNNYRGGWKRK